MTESVPIPQDARETPSAGVVIVYHWTHEDCVNGIMARGLIPDCGGDWEYSRGIAQDGGPIRNLNKIFNEVAKAKDLPFIRTDCAFADLARQPARSPFENIALWVRTNLVYVADRRLFDEALRNDTSSFRQVAEEKAALYWEKMIKLDAYLGAPNGLADPEVLLPHGNGIVEMQLVDDEWKRKQPLLLSVEYGQE